MKTILRFFFAVLLGLFGTSLHAGNLTVTINPAAAVSAGAKWRVDGGSWRNSGATVNGLSNTTHTVEFRSTSGWLTPADQVATITSGNTTSLTATYVQPASLKITLTPTSGQWRIDGGAWQASGATVTGLTPGSHSVSYSAVSGYAILATENITLVANQTTTLSRSYTQLSSLKINLTPSSGTQWRVDGGAWQASGATVANLAPGAHTVDYNALSGYAAPISESVTLVSGQLLTVARSYVQLASLAITLTPSTAQWRVDGGTWLASGATAANLSVGNHTVEYAAVSGYTAPATESVTLASGQALSLTRSYVQLASLAVTLTPSTAQWRVDGGVWRASGTTAANLSLGSHTVEYAAASGYITPSSESVTLSAGQALTLTRTYVQLASVALTLTPSSAQWRVDGGAWLASGTTAANLTPGAHTIDYAAAAGYVAPSSESVTLTAGQALALTRSYTQLATVAITLVPASGQWRADGGPWQTSGASLAVLPGNHTLEYAALSLYDSPATETITLAAGGAFSATRSYVSQKPTLRLNLTPAAGQWRVDGGTWQASGATVAELAVGNHTVDYSDVGGDYAPLASETVSLALRENQVLARSYALKPATLSLALTPTSGTWRAYPAGQSATGTWQASGATLTALTPGNYTVEYAAVANYEAPATETVTLSPNQTATFSRSYTAHPAQVAVTLAPATGTQWRIYPAAGSPSDAWNDSGVTVSGLAVGSYTVEYATLTGYTAPATETIALTAGQSASLSRSYTALPGQLSLTVTPASAQWRIDGGTWQASGATVTGLVAGSHTVDYSTVNGYITPASESVALTPGQSLALTLSYVQLAEIWLSLQPATGQWRVDGGAWQPSGSRMFVLPGAHTVDFLPLDQYDPPATNTQTYGPGGIFYGTLFYTPRKPSLRIDLTPATGQWRLDNGPWQASGTRLTGISVGDHLISYLDLGGSYDPIASEGINLVSLQDATLTRSYPLKRAAVTATLTPGSATWLVYPAGMSPAGAWQSSGATQGGFAPGDYSISYSTVPGYVTPAVENFTLAPGQTATFNKVYVQQPPADVTVTLTPSSAQWRLYASTGTPPNAWNSSGITVGGLLAGDYVIEYAAASGYVTPTTETVTLAVGQSLAVTRTYAPYTPNGQLSIGLYPSSAQWRVDGGAWQASGATVAGLAPGSHTVDYSLVDGYATPASETVIITTAQTLTLSRYYSQLASVRVTVYPSSAKWRVDGGAWQDSDAIVSNLAYDVTHTVEYQDAPGYATPASETFTPYSGQQVTLYRYYGQLASVTVTLYPSAARWRVDGGAWQPSGAVVGNLAYNSTHTVDYEPFPGYVAPPSDSFSPYSGQQVSYNRYYAQLASVTVTLYPSAARWRVDGGAWQPSGAVVGNLSYSTSHTIDYEAFPGYVAPPSDSFTPYSGQQVSYNRYYAQLASVTVTLYPSAARWRVDGGDWQSSGAVVGNLAYNSTHTIDYESFPGYVAPPSDSFSPYSGQLVSYSRYYGQLASVTASLYPSNARWRVDGGAWQVSGAIVGNLAYSANHTVEYEPVAGYVTPQSDTFWPYSGQLVSYSRYYSQLASVSVTLTPSQAQWRVDGGVWQASGAVVGNLSYSSSHTIDYAPLPGYITPASETVSPYSGQALTLTRFCSPSAAKTHRLRFFLHPDLVGSMTTAEVGRRLAQYAAHLNTIFPRESQRGFTFDPISDITVASANPLSNSFTGTLPETGFELWLYVQLTDNPTYGTYGGNAGLDASGAGGAYNLRWDQIHDPTALADNTPAMDQYWRQIDHITHELEHVFGAGLGEYYSMGGLKDVTGVAPILPDVQAVNSSTVDAFWSTRSEYWTDPLTANAYANPRVGSPTALATLLNLTSFAPVTEAILNGAYRDPSRRASTLPDLSAVRVKVVDAKTGQPIPAATLRVWNRQRPAPPADTYEETVAATGTPGVFTFAWTGAPVPLNNYDNAKLLKAYAPGYTATAQWTTVYDAQKAKLVDGQTTFEVTIALTPQ